MREKCGVKNVTVAMLVCTGALAIGSCTDREVSIVPDQSQAEVMKDEIVGTWVDSVDGVSGAYCAYGIFADGRFECYTAESSAQGSSKMSMDSLSGTWKYLANIPNRWDDEESDMLQGIEVTFDAPLATAQEKNPVDTLIMEKREDGGLLLIWTSEIDRYAAGLAVETGQTRGWLSNAWNSVKQAVTSTFKKIAYPVSDFFVAKFGGETQKIVRGYSDWMGSAYGDVNPKVCDLTIPGSHDTFTYNYSGVAKKGVKTQGLDIARMWDAGVRCFDVRMDWRKQDNTLGLNHGLFYLGINLNEGLNKIRDQLKAHPKETAIVILKFEDKESTNDYRTVYNAVKRLKNEGYVVSNPTPDMRLSQCRGKIIFIQRYDSNSYNLDIRATGWDEDNRKLVFSNGKSADLSVADLFTGRSNESKSSYLSRKKKSMTNVFQKAAGASSNQNLWCFNHASGYWALVPALGNNPGEIAEVMNPWVKDYMNSHKGKKTGVVMLDFAGTNYHSFGYSTNGQEVMSVLINNNIDLRNDQRISLK